MAYVTVHILEYFCWQVYIMAWRFHWYLSPPVCRWWHSISITAACGAGPCRRSSRRSSSAFSPKSCLFNSISPKAVLLAPNPKYLIESTILGAVLPSALIRRSQAKWEVAKYWRDHMWCLWPYWIKVAHVVGVAQFIPFSPSHFIPSNLI